MRRPPAAPQAVPACADCRTPPRRCRHPADPNHTQVTAVRRATRPGFRHTPAGRSDLVNLGVGCTGCMAGETICEYARTMCVRPGVSVLELGLLGPVRVVRGPERPAWVGPQLRGWPSP